MNSDMLMFIRTASDEKLAEVAVRVAAIDPDAFARAAVEVGMEGYVGYDFPHGYEKIKLSVFNEIKSYCERGNKVAAIKSFRTHNNSDLMTAKRAVEYLIDKGIVALGGPSYTSQY
jgi:ribosomal protein L7/L12